MPGICTFKTLSKEGGLGQPQPKATMKNVVARPPPHEWRRLFRGLAANRVVEFAKKIQPSERGEKEITALNQMYLEQAELKVVIMTRGMVWLDTGTIASLDAATEFVRVIEKRTNKKIACIEEIAFLHGFISSEQALEVAEKYGKSEYGIYVKKCAQE